MASAGLRLLLVVMICPFIILTLACEYRNQYAGIYHSDNPGSESQGDVVLELKQNGEGLWRTGGDEIPFSWSIKGRELRINTRGGGVITGGLDGKIIEITLPGATKMTFQKSPG